MLFRSINNMKWEENVRRVVPYTPGEQPKKAGIIKLNTNESPYPPAPGVAKAAAALDAEKFRLYPEFPERTELAELAVFVCYVAEHVGAAVIIEVDIDIHMAYRILFHRSRRSSYAY